MAEKKSDEKAVKAEKASEKKEAKEKPKKTGAVGKAMEAMKKALEKKKAAPKAEKEGKEKPAEKEAKPAKAEESKAKAKKPEADEQEASGAHEAKMPAKEKQKVSGRKAGYSRSADWVEMKPAEAEEIIAKLTEQGHTPSEIGMILRDQHGVPSIRRLCGKKVDAIIAAHNMQPEMPRDLLNLIRKSVTLMKHMVENKKDFTAQRGYQLTVSKINKLVAYYHTKKRLPQGWRYSPEAAKLMVK